MSKKIKKEKKRNNSGKGGRGTYPFLRLWGCLWGRCRGRGLSIKFNKRIIKKILNKFFPSRGGFFKAANITLGFKTPPHPTHSLKY